MITAVFSTRSWVEQRRLLPMDLTLSDVDDVWAGMASLVYDCGVVTSDVNLLLLLRGLETQSARANTQLRRMSHGHVLRQERLAREQLHWHVALTRLCGLSASVEPREIAR
jgi:hypothetical protein